MPTDTNLAILLAIAFVGSIASFALLPRIGKATGPVAANCATASSAPLLSWRRQCCEWPISFRI